MNVLKDVKIILKNEEYKDLIDTLPDSVFGICEGFVLQDSEVVGDFGVKSIIPRDFEESRIVSFEIDEKRFEIKGAARVLKDKIEKIDAFGPYETGPPGGLFLEFAKKEFERYLEIKDFVETVNIPLTVNELPFEFDFKSQKDKSVKKRKLATILRLVNQPKRIEELCYEENPQIDVETFCENFGKNIYNLLYKAKKTHFALWDGGDVGVDGSIADYDSIHDLNERDLADTIDGCFSTILRLCSKMKFDEKKGLGIFLKEVTGKDFVDYGGSVKFLIKELLDKEPNKGILEPKYIDKKHS